MTSLSPLRLSLPRAQVLKRKKSVSGAGRYGTSADMWSLGVVLYILLSGSFPFLDDENLFDHIEHAHYNVTGQEWAGISNAAKHMVRPLFYQPPSLRASLAHLNRSLAHRQVRSLLTLRPEHRLTVKTALAHPWITGQAMPSSLPASQASNQSQSHS